MSATSTLLPPLPERMRPDSLDRYVGQRHLVGEGCVLRKMIESGNLSSFILWGMVDLGASSPVLVERGKHPDIPSWSGIPLIHDQRVQPMLQSWTRFHLRSDFFFIH